MAGVYGLAFLRQSISRLGLRSACLHAIMKSATSTMPKHRALQRVELLLLVALIIVAAYLWTGPWRAERALRGASFDTLLAASKRDPNNPRVFYYLGQRLRDLGHLGP